MPIAIPAHEPKMSQLTSAGAYGMLATPNPDRAVPTIIIPRRLKRLVSGPISPPWMMTPSRPMNAKTHPLSLSLHPRPPLSGSIEVNSMKVPCIMVNPRRNRKLTTTREEMVGSLSTEAMLEAVSPICDSGEAPESDLFPGGRLSGSLLNARMKAIEDIALEKRHGRR